jgi:hypothetical protein
MNFMTTLWRAGQIERGERNYPNSLLGAALGMGGGVPV